MPNPLIELCAHQWIGRLKEHEKKVGPYAEAFIKRRDIRKRHPVHDFLFTYYPFSPTKLRQWVPSYGESLLIDPYHLADYPWLDHELFAVEKGCLSLNLEKIPKTIPALLNFVIPLCENIIHKPPRLGCFGLHEWAMVYRASPQTLRHQGYALRISSENLAGFVESQKLCCTHYDAYRFFTPEAKPRNLYHPTLDERLEMEQGGCIHANMDLYKWAAKFWPWIGSDFIAKAFFLALEGRELDMRASPYDLVKDGYLPIPIETEEGRKDYQKEQQHYAEKADLLRKEFLTFCKAFNAIF